MKKLISLICSSLFILSSGCSTSPTGRSQFIVVPDSQMSQMGLQAFSEMKMKVPIEYNVQINNYVKCIARAIATQANSKIAVDKWEVVVFKDPTANAFALPGGKIGVHTGLLKIAATPDQLAAVLGHEVGHVIARHGSERVSQAMATQTGVIVASELLGEKNQNRDLILAGLGLGAQFGVLLPFSRKHESEADEIGLMLMAEAGFNPQEAITLWHNMAKAGGSAPPEFMSTHPSNDSRIHDLNKNMPKALAEYNKAQSRGLNPECGSPQNL